MTILRAALCATGCILPLVIASPARAQSASTRASTDALPPARPWTVEMHGGDLRGVSPTGGTGQLPPYGGSFQTVNGETSPVVSSWFFGDGTAWFNGFGGVVSSSGKIKPLDTALTSSSL